MKVYKDKQFLVFDFEDGRNVKYDFATKTAIGIKGKPVQDLNKQLRGFSLNELFDCCIDKQYAKFLKFIAMSEYYEITNIGTMLNRVPRYAKYEQIYSAGFEDIVDRFLNYTINEIPKALIKVAKTHNVKINNDLIKFWKENPDAYNLAFQLEYLSLDDKNLNDILKLYDLKYNCDTHTYIRESYVNILINKYGYNAKSLFLYLDTLKTFEAIDKMETLLRELCDYANMMSTISPKFDKYPRHFLTTHQIAVRNYNRLKKEFSEELFKKRINKDYECTYKDYVFIYPNCVQDIRDETVSQNNCVASYIDKVIDGNCHILFLRKKSSPKESLVTIEVRDDKIVQAKRRFNYPVTKEDQEAIDYWNNKFSKQNKKEKEKAA